MDIDVELSSVIQILKERLRVEPVYVCLLLGFHHGKQQLFGEDVCLKRCYSFSFFRLIQKKPVAAVSVFIEYVSVSDSALRFRGTDGGDGGSGLLMAGCCRRRRKCGAGNVPRLFKAQSGETHVAVCGRLARCGGVWSFAIAAATCLGASRRVPGRIDSLLPVVASEFRLLRSEMEK